MDTSVIPRGYYCYDEKGTCPYWELREDKPKQANGFCKFMGTGDWEEEEGDVVDDHYSLIRNQSCSSLLWDQCKECGINKYTDEEIEDLIQKGVIVVSEFSEKYNKNLTKLQLLQKEVNEYDRANYPKNNSVRMTLGIIEENGELAEAIEKNDIKEIKNAVADIMVFSMQLASFENVDWENNLEYNGDDFTRITGDPKSLMHNSNIVIPLGRLSHHILKREQGLGKAEDHLEHIKEALKDIGFYCIHIAAKYDFNWRQNFVEVVEGEVLKRDRKEREQKYIDSKGK